MKKISYLFLTFLLLTLTAESNAQAPKWLDKARQSVFSVVTFDAEGNVFCVFFADIGHGKVYIGQIYALSVGNDGIVAYGADRLCLRHFLHLQLQ